MSLPPAHGARGTFSTWREAARIPAHEGGRGPPSLSVAKDLKPPLRPAGEMVVGAHGLGPWTSSLSETRSNQLSYAPEPPPPGTGQRNAACLDWRRLPAGLLLYKEVIQPQVPLRLPCYDFIPVVDAGLDASRRLRTAPTPMM